MLFYDYYYRNNKIFLSSIGLWLYQGTLSKYFSFVILVITGGSQIYIQTGGMIAAYYEDMDVFLQSIPPVVVNALVVIKHINFTYNNRKMKILFNALIEDWNRFQDSKEIEILQEYAAKAKKITLIYCACVYGGLAPVVILPTIPALLEVAGVLNITGTKALPFPVQYFVNVDKYYHEVLLDAFLGTLSLVMVVVSVDTMFVVYVNHACCMFKIIGCRLKNILETDQLSINFRTSVKNDVPYRNISYCVMLHNKLLSYVDLIEDANTTSFFCQMGINIACITFTGFQAVMLMDRPTESVRYVAFCFAQLSHLFFQSWPPQKLFDHSIELTDTVNNGEWYFASINTKQSLRMLIMRSIKPCRLTAGKIYVLNIESFSAVLRSCMSYFTVLTSTQ